MTPKELDDILALGRKHGLRTLKVGDVIAEYGPMPQATSSLPSEPGEVERMPTEDELLFMSSIPLTDSEIKARAP